MSAVEASAARIQVMVYRAEDGIRWRITSSARGRRIISESSESYVRKADAFRGLLMTTGGTYASEIWFRTPFGGAYEQGAIIRPTPWGGSERIFVEYVSKP